MRPRDPKDAKMIIKTKLLTTNTIFQNGGQGMSVNLCTVTVQSCANSTLATEHAQTD